MHHLSRLASAEHYLFTPHDLRVLAPDLSDSAYRTLLCRSVQAGHLARVCRGLYLYEPVAPPSGLELFHMAARLRAGAFNYISLETVLSEAGVIAQVPINRISVMSSGRSNNIRCGRWGAIEFIHTLRRPEQLAGQLRYDARSRLWWAGVPLAMRDMRVTRRDQDLIDLVEVHDKRGP